MPQEETEKRACTILRETDTLQRRTFRLFQVHVFNYNDWLKSHFIIVKLFYEVNNIVTIMIL